MPSWTGNQLSNLSINFARDCEMCYTTVTPSWCFMLIMFVLVLMFLYSEKYLWLFYCCKIKTEMFFQHDIMLALQDFTCYIIGIWTRTRTWQFVHKWHVGGTASCHTAAGSLHFQHWLLCLLVAGVQGDDAGTLRCLKLGTGHSLAEIQLIVQGMTTQESFLTAVILWARIFAYIIPVSILY